MTVEELIDEANKNLAQAYLDLAEFRAETNLLAAILITSEALTLITEAQDKVFIIKGLLEKED